MNKIKYLAMAIGCLVSTSSFANDSQDLQQKLQQINSFQAHFSQQVTDSQGASIMQGSGNIALKQPMMIRWEQINPDETLFISNGDKTYYFDSFAEQVTIMDTHSLIDSTPFVLLTSKDPAQWQKYKVVATDNGFSVTPNKGVESQVEQLDILFADNQQGLAKLVVKDVSGQSSAFSFSESKINTELAPSTFEFTPPEGVDIDDQSQGE